MARSKSEYATALDATPGTSFTSCCGWELRPVGDHFQAKMLAAPKPNGDTSHSNLRLLPPFYHPRIKAPYSSSKWLPPKTLHFRPPEAFADLQDLLRFGGCTFPTTGHPPPWPSAQTAGDVGSLNFIFAWKLHTGADRRNFTLSKTKSNTVQQHTGQQDPLPPTTTRFARTCLQASKERRPSADLVSGGFRGTRGGGTLNGRGSHTVTRALYS